MTTLLCPSRTFLCVTSREISSNISDAKYNSNVRKKLNQPILVLKYAEFTTASTDVMGCQASEASKMSNFFIASLWASQQASDLMVLTVSGCTSAGRPRGRVASFLSVTVV